MRSQPSVINSSGSSRFLRCREKRTHFGTGKRSAFSVPDANGRHYVHLASLSTIGYAVGMNTIESDLRSRIQKSSVSLYKISQQSGVDLSYLSRFVHRKQPLGSSPPTRVSLRRSTLELPKPMFDTALYEDGTPPVSGKFHRRKCNLSTRICRCGDGSFNVFHE